MADEYEYIAALRTLATDPAARGLMDDAAVLPVGDIRLVLTSDTLVEGVHFLASDPADSIGWKLAAVNLSDLAAKGATPRACLMNYALSGNDDWDADFLRGLRAALDIYGMPLIGGDTVAMPKGAPRSFTLTAIGEAGSGPVPARSGARAGDILYVTGPVGDSGAGLALLTAGQKPNDNPTTNCLIDAYRRPQPRLAQGQALVPYVTAMMDISDGLLIDARRMGEASGVGIVIDHVPLSDAFIALHGPDARIAAATSGDDYELLFAAAPDVALPVPAIAVGRCEAGVGLRLILDGKPIPLPERLGYQHTAYSERLT
ncbi:thiamine-phosphate kinase [Sphingobium algorifonticola]|uniref:Thiamine-monophosphate kinase n=1 Tax=Sphingobium algorifonticola TaxID=2008318 RepID=A0A437J9J0_9SPHN|nr:thiamine-phosphate kinase [Sphingobium algorifonticola]RVT42060.1 thiamine-phosphate kinase [Sphingobium algorifonticola]